MTSASLLRLGALCALAAATFPMSASGADPISLVGQGGKVVLGEVETLDEFNQPFTVNYFVDVLDPAAEVAAFAVSTDFKVSTRSEGGGVRTTFPGWNGYAITRETWDSGSQFTINGATTVTTNSLGPAASLFGNDQRIVIYYLETGGVTIFDHGASANDQDPETWDPVTNNVFQIDGRSRSEFIALGLNGQVIDFSSQIPEPSAVVLGTLACLGLLRRRRR